MKDRNLDRLFRRFRDKNDGAALAAVFDATAREFLDVACHLVQDAHVAEDVVQETFVAAIRSAERFDAARSVKAWLYGILWREAQKARRCAARTVEPDRLADRSEVQPVEAMLAREVPSEIWRVLAALPRRYREVLEPHIREGRSPEQIARELGRAPGTVRSQIHRGLGRLRRALPRGLAPASGLGLIIAGGENSLRGLDGLRGEVLSVAGHSSTTAVALPMAALKTSAASILTTKPILLGAAAAAVAAVGGWALHRGVVGETGEDTSRGVVLAKSNADARSKRTALAALQVAESAEGRAPVGDSLPTAKVDPDDDPIAYWLARFNENPDSWRHGLKIANQVAALPPEEALAIMTAVWPELSEAAKEQVLKPFVFGDGHPHALPLLHLAATDASLSVQGRAFTYLEAYAFQDFSVDYQAYLVWAETWRDRPLAEVLSENARRFANDLLALSPEDLGARLRSLKRLDLDTGRPVGVDLAAVMREAGGLRVLTTCLQLEDPEARSIALSWSKSLRADEAWLRRFVLPVVENPGQAEAASIDPYLRALGRPDCGWAQKPLLGFIERLANRPPDEGWSRDNPGPGAFDAADALSEIGDPAVIPALIELLVHDRSGSLDYTIGYYGLSGLTGVDWHESHDADWWLGWWDKNQDRLPAEVRAVTVDRGGR